MNDNLLLLKYLRAARRYGPSAASVTRQFCDEILGIGDIDAAIAELCAAGHLVTVTDNGEIRLEA